MRYCLAGSTISLILFGSAMSELTIGARVPAVAQAVSDRKAEANRLIKQGTQQLQTSNYKAAIQSYEQALAIYREMRKSLIKIRIAAMNMAKHKHVWD